jgi:endonuclease/exonuclease/phosphatase family metal-dependent hydrolase
LALAAWGLLYAGDAWAPATVLLFGPRWLLAVLPALLILPARRAGRRASLAAVAALVVALGPLMEFNLPLGRAAPEGGPRLRVLTCNMHYGGDAAALEALVADTGPDVVALQEWREPTRPPAPAWDGWHVRRLPGLFLASRFPVRAADRLGPNSTGERGSAARYELDTPAGPVTVVSLHLASPREDLKGAVMTAGPGLDGLAENSALRDRQSAYLAAAAEVSGPVLVVGDFNAPAESAVFRRHWGGYRDAFGDAGWGWGHTFANRWTRVRIDHVLVGGGGRASDCRVGPAVGSPHRPVLADLAWPAAR